MDFYNYYCQKLQHACSPETSIENAADEAVKLIDEAPVAIGLEAGIGLLAALHAYGNPQGVELAPAFQKVELAMNCTMYAMRCDLEATDNLWEENLTLGADSYRHMGDPSQAAEPETEEHR